MTTFFLVIFNSNICQPEKVIRPKNTCVSANPIDPVFVFFFFCVGVCADPAIVIAFQKKIIKISIPTDLKMFQKIGQKT